MESDLPQLQEQSLVLLPTAKRIAAADASAMFKSMTIWVVASTLMSPHRQGLPRKICLKPSFHVHILHNEPKAILSGKKRGYSQGTF